MQSWPIERKIRYEGDLDPGFAKGISTAPGGEHLAQLPGTDRACATGHPER